MGLLHYHYIEKGSVLLCAAILIAAALRGTARNTRRSMLLLLGGFSLLVVHQAIGAVAPMYALPWPSERSWIYGIASVAGIAGWLLIVAYCLTWLRARPDGGPDKPAIPQADAAPKTAITAILGLGVGVATNCFTACTMLTLLWVPRGAEIRPMGHAVLAFTFAFGAFFLGAPLSAIGCAHSRGWRRLWGIVGILLNLAVLPLGIVLLHVVTYLAGFTLAE